MNTQFKKCLLALSLLIAIPTLGTDCKSDCRKNCESTYSFLGVSHTEVDPLCHARCIAEKEIACRTGITTCDTWKVSALSPYFYGAIKIIETANRQDWRPHDEHDCQMFVDQAASLGTAGGAGQRMYDAYQLGLSAALTVNKATVVGAIVSEGAKHFLHCACSASNFVEHGSTSSGAPATPNRDTYYISRIRKSDGKWAERQGAAANRANLVAQSNQIMDNHWDRSESGFFDSSKRTLTEVECREGHRINIQNGGTSSLSAAFKDVTDRGWKACLFRVSNTSYGINDIPIADRYFSSMTSNGGGFSLHHGSNSDQANIHQKTKDGINGGIASDKSGRYSSSRLTRTQASCHVTSSASGGLSIEEDVLYLQYGQGDESLTKAFQKAKESNYKKCLFTVEDFGFSRL